MRSIEKASAISARKQRRMASRAETQSANACSTARASAAWLCERGQIVTSAFRDGEGWVLG